MQRINLTNSSLVTLVDDEDCARALSQNWYLEKHGNSFYAAAKPEGVKIYLHQLILPARDGFEPDHISRDGLDNRKENLRYATVSQNNANKEITLSNISGFKGVSWDRWNRKWRAQITKNRKATYLGCFENKIDAALAYNAAAIKYHGEFAVLNNIAV